MFLLEVNTQLELSLITLSYPALLIRSDVFSIRLRICQIDQIKS